MEKFSPFQIIKQQDLELITILENYSNYTNPTILYAYAEFTRRKLIQNELIVSNIEEFEKKYLEFDNYDINSSIKAWCQKEGAESYDELYLTFIGQEKIQTDRILEKNQTEKNLKSKQRLREINPGYIAAAGQSLKSVLFVALIMIICSALGFIGIYSSNDIETITTIYKTLGIVSLLAWLIMLLMLYSAGRNLENSVYNK